MHVLGQIISKFKSLIFSKIIYYCKRGDVTWSSFWSLPRSLCVIKRRKHGFVSFKLSQSIPQLIAEWQNLTLKCYAYTFVKAQVEEECQQTIFYLKGYSYPKFYYNKMNTNQKPTANTVSSTKRTTLGWMRGEIKKLLFIKVTVYLPFLFEKNLN